VEAAQDAVRCAERGEQNGHRAEAQLALGESLQASGRRDLAAARFRDAVEQARASEMPRHVEQAQRARRRVAGRGDAASSATLAHDADRA
jgi:hypothetical protein